VHVEALARPSQPDPGAATGVAVHYAADDRPGALLAPRDLGDRRRWRAEEPVRPLRELAGAARRLRAFGPDHIHAHFAAGAALDALRLSRLLGVPYSLTTHGYDIFQTPRNLCEKHARAAFATSVCDYSVDHLRGRCPGARIERQVMGVDGERFRRTRPHPGGRTVVAVARLTEKKGLRHLVAAAALLRERGEPIDVLIAGDGPLRGELTAPDVTLLGARTPDQVHELLERADVLAAPSVIAVDGDRDTMPVSVKEALAMEVPVVASDLAGLPEVVSDAWGRLVAPGDPAALAAAIGGLLALPVAARAALGRAGRAHVLEHCSLATETARLVELIHD
jgi:colanic acid/amylovoran biosynthesis glycosyltransferase